MNPRQPHNTTATVSTILLPLPVTIMGNYESPTEEEKDRFEELYNELGSARKVADHEDVDWSRATVSKWLKRRGVMSSPDSEDPEEGVSEPDDPEGSGVETAVQQTPDPNDILRRVVRKDPGLGDDELDWLNGYIEDYGVLSSNDVRVCLDQLKFSNKNMTIHRVVNRYIEAVNRVLRENRHLMYEEPWATLLTKETGQPYNRNPQPYQSPTPGQGPSVSPPPAQQPTAGGGAGQSQITPPPAERPAQNGEQPVDTRGQQQNQQTPQQAAIQPPQPNPYMGYPPQQPPQQQNGGGDELSPLEEFAMEMLKDQMNEDEPEQPEPEPQETGIDKLRELRELQEEIDGLVGNGGDDDSANQVEQIASVLDERLSRLESQINQSGSQQTTPTPSIPGAGDDTGGSLDLAGIAQLAESGVDPELVEMAVKMQTDPDVIKAEIEREKAMNDGKWKEAVFESLSPAATEKAVDALASLATGVMEAGRAGRQRQTQQEEVRTRRGDEFIDEAEQPAQGETGGVEVVEEAEPAPAGPSRESTEVTGSPMRQQNVAEQEEPQPAEPVERAEEDEPTEESVDETGDEDEADEEVSEE